MPTHLSRLGTFIFATAVTILAVSGSASADPPSRVGRLGYLTGAVSFSPAGEIDWIQATMNRPLTTGDRLWTDAGARAEIELGGAAVRMTAATAVSVLNLDDQIAQFQLTQGVVDVRVRALEPDQVFEVDTPNLAFILRQPGVYRIEVDPAAGTTTAYVRRGQGEAFGEAASFLIEPGQAIRFAGTDLREYQAVEAARLDEFDRWASKRDRRYDDSLSSRYVSPDVIGYQDLDANGLWRVEPNYGYVWIPNRVAAGWAPYRDGHWTWVDPWGWTWVDDAPWGFAVSHYGRWANLGGTWGWVPGPLRSRAYYAPALVAFVGGADFQLTISSGSVGGIAWFPLGPRDVYRPSYPVSRRYFENVNRSNTVINNTVINNYYNNTNVSNVSYANRQVPGAVIAVPTTAFVQSEPVGRSAVPLPRQVASSAAVAFAPPVAPTETSVRGAAARGDKPPARAFERPIIARTAPPAVRPGFAAQQRQLTAKPGQPLDEAARNELKPAATPATAPVVKLVAPVAPAAPAQGNARVQTPPAAQPAESRGKAYQRGRDVARPQAGYGPQGTTSPPVAQPQANPSVPPGEVVTPAPAAQPQVRPSTPANAAGPAQPAVAPASAAQATDERVKPRQRARVEQPAPPVAAPAPQHPAEKPVAAPQGIPAAPAAQKRAPAAIPEPALAATQTDPRLPAAARRPPPPPPQTAPAAAEPHGQDRKGSADKAKEPKKDPDEPKR